MSVTDILTLALAAIGVVFMFLAAIGMLKLPDLYTRVHATGKAGTLGITGVLLAVAVHHGDLVAAAKMIALIAFFLLTAPVAAHMLDRAAYLTGVERAPQTVQDDLAGKYDVEQGRLRS
ncbi:monovalent cation/H(+) antiporter subunit G [Chloroflexus sp.]|uniref:monovalent cation/H(+) antiporter subunit G n=1 Tax=Chloroflexus sp. TaxID=1904827 RepID=UPI00298F3200|nr:monovalent cation/H(+) antiporter subunit G [Chloroflexus sp.]MCS6889505.1 monovalent cation/H(+) antiporter subunit G [Chloroflexus sp.]MCX7860829.1 monovalent cation/H(+) antiporter subunit G [Chloroflexus sp.]MDW8405371.1 monovalent cation/H(+) antiporter subunit G [Chloroflexus sp.]